VEDVELKEILQKHWKWRCKEEGGQRADLRGAYLQEADLQEANLQEADLRWANLRWADLRGADLQEADLREANLRWADLRGVDLQEADLQGADLRGANLRGANLRGVDLQEANLRGVDLQEADLQNCMLDGINWLAYIGIVPDHKGTARAYKIVDEDGYGIHYGGINYLDGTRFKVKDIDTDIFVQCGAGVNLATFAWCLSEKRRDSDRLLMFSFNTKDAVCPVASDGKFRVSKCRKIGECDWKGNLLPKDSNA